MAKKFLKAKGRDIKTGVQSATRHVKFNTKTIEYIVYNSVTGQIITYYLPKWSSYNSGSVSSFGWAIKAFQYFAERIR